MLKEDYFENDNFTPEEKANTAFQIVTGMRDVLNMALKGNYVPTYEKALAYIKDISPNIHQAIIAHLPEKNESDLVKRFREEAQSELNSEEEEASGLEINDVAVRMINAAIDKCDNIIQSNKEASKDGRANKNYKRQLVAALKSFITRTLSEHELLIHDFTAEEKPSFELIDKEFDRKDYNLPDGKILRIYLAHPNKIEYTLGVDVIYECYDLTLRQVRFANLQYKTWKLLSLSFDEREEKQLNRLKTNNCDCKHCEVPTAYASTSPYRFPYCSAFVRPTNKILAKGSKMKTMGDHIPLCRLNQLRESGQPIEKYQVQNASLTQQSFEEAFNKYHVGSRWMQIGDLQQFYEKRKLKDMADNIRIIVQEIDFPEDVY